MLADIINELTFFNDWRLLYISQTTVSKHWRKNYI